MGALGFGLYYLTYPLHYPLFGDINDWKGKDLFWPSVIWAGMLWSASFLLAGFNDVKLKRTQASKTKRVLVYGVILWLGAGAVWIFVALTSGFEFP